MTKIFLDKERYLHFTLNAMERFEDETGKSIFSLDIKDMRIKDLKALVWSALCETEEIGIDVVGGLISLENLQEVNKAIEEEFSKAMPTEKKRQEEQAKK